jgi:hypothetical protein
MLGAGKQKDVITNFYWYIISVICDSVHCIAHTLTEWHALQITGIGSQRQTDNNNNMVKRQ